MLKYRQQMYIHPFSEHFAENQSMGFLSCLPMFILNKKFQKDDGDGEAALHEIISGKDK